MQSLATEVGSEVSLEVVRDSSLNRRATGASVSTGGPGTWKTKRNDGLCNATLSLVHVNRGRVPCFHFCGLEWDEAVIKGRC